MGMRVKLMAALCALMLALGSCSYHEAAAPSPEECRGAAMEWERGVTIIWK